MSDLEWRDARLDWDSLPSHPMDLFSCWHAAAIETEPWQAGAMLLSTATKDGIPSARIVLLRGVDDEGLRFYTNYESRKASVLDENASFAAVFWWPSQVRQVRIEGQAERLPRAASEAYFASRPRGSQLGAWSSPQSQTIRDLEFLEQRYEEVRTTYADQQVPCPPFWGGYLLRPLRVEFWQGGKDRLHDRALYEKEKQKWLLRRLAP